MRGLRLSPDGNVTFSQKTQLHPRGRRGPSSKGPEAGAWLPAGGVPGKLGASEKGATSTCQRRGQKRVQLAGFLSAEAAAENPTKGERRQSPSRVYGLALRMVRRRSGR